ncbi:hypothetical protein ORI20_21515 [Mycobacterium sp. CVI_P3]|uniref:Uncharacterized protein n=1 Tax=Mycobacterium pinniadriaticum TaxID=2994102 RepID=A0ABT3SK87_9MYCO|nr:hypothetical protein [Mycobacterium pinniadriaticum]MCX2932856.1 hypothetical protein [Mycobacterium pinniadriaticum]MCX2939280.1 hypothetical protein [Mycobacterium pinniadriaticum]
MTLLTHLDQWQALLADPDRVDLARTGAAHVGFGHGLHYRVGAALARLELKTVYSQHIPRFPALRLCADPSTMTGAPIPCHTASSHGR